MFLEISFDQYRSSVVTIILFVILVSLFKVNIFRERPFPQAIREAEKKTKRIVYEITEIKLVTVTKSLQPT